MKRWFGPKWIGWGASPASWEGWLVTGLLVAGLLGLARAPIEDRTAVLVASGALVSVYLLVVAVTFGSRDAAVATPRLRVAAVWGAYLTAIAAVSAWGWRRLASGPLAIHWNAQGVADNFAPGEQVLLAVPIAAAVLIAALAVLSGGGRRSGAMAASIALLSGLLLLHLAYVAAQLGVLT